MTRLAVWGTYDLGKPRTRIVLAALRQAGFDLDEIHREIWGAVADKSQQSRMGWASRFVAIVCTWPLLIWRYMRAPDHVAVIIPYMGIFDVLVLWPFARLRKKPIIWDAFLSIYDTVVSDRAMARPGSIPARLLFALESLACAAATRIVLDTKAHARLFTEMYRLPPEKTAAIMVGAEAQTFSPLPFTRSGEGETGAINVLFYGQFIPLHGIGTIVEAARMAQGLPIDWTLIGYGQEVSRIARQIEGDPLPRLRWTRWVPYAELAAQIARADICLGIFGQSGKAMRVIPNKVFQVIAAGRPLISADSPAMRELVGENARGVYLVPPGDPAALISAIEQCRADLSEFEGDCLHGELRAQFALDRLARDWAGLVVETCGAVGPDKGY